MKSLRWRLAQSLEIRWWKRYLSDKNPEEYIRWKKAYWNQLLNELLPELNLTSDSRVLDAGCGPSGIFIALREFEVVAIDPLLEAYKELPHFKPEEFPNTKFISTNIEHFRYDKKFDVIFCLNAINHVADIQKAYDVLNDLLKQEGKLVISVDAHNSNFLKQLFRAIPGDVLHPHQYDLKEYEQFLNVRGLNVLKTIRKDKRPIFNYYVQVAEKKL